MASFQLDAKLLISDIIIANVVVSFIEDKLGQLPLRLSRSSGSAQVYV